MVFIGVFAVEGWPGVTIERPILLDSEIPLQVATSPLFWRRSEKVESVLSGDFCGGYCRSMGRQVVVESWS